MIQIRGVPADVHRVLKSRAALEGLSLSEDVGGGARGRPVGELLVSGREVWCPHLVDAEVGQALRRAVLRQEMGSDRALIALDVLADLPLHRALHRPLARTAWSLRNHVSYYDALYVALAAALDAPLLTLDARLAAVPGLPAVVEVLASP
ncbi:MAG: type II toxin-antitoxin system VapC family toxin [Actinomycetota bacterium]|nr:type II toxin-antitoxin system VapC family toxin [Actinomycetota bacterium]